MDMVGSFPSELQQRIFWYLSPIDLGRAACVSRSWNRAINRSELWQSLDLKKYFPLLKVIDGSIWKKSISLEMHGLSVEDEPILDKRALCPLLHKFSSLPIEDHLGFTLLTIPKGLNLRKLKTIGLVPKKGNRCDLSRSILEPFERVITQSKVVLISNALLDGTRVLVEDEQEKFLKERECEVPDLLTMATLLTMTYITSQHPPTRLFNDDETFYFGRCIDKMDGKSIGIGRFREGGFLFVKITFISTGIIGVAAQRNL